MTNKPLDKVDYLFIGLGASNCLLIINMDKLGLLSKKTIAIIEPNDNILSDRNFCLWITQKEIEELNLNSLVSNSWNKIKISNSDSQDVSPLNYVHINGSYLNSQTRSILDNHKVKFYNQGFYDEPNAQSDSYLINLSNSIIISKKVFDSRPPKLVITEKNQSKLQQSLYGWTIKTSKHKFDCSTMVMMDFDIPQNDYCQFMYILPFNESTALFEVTRFGKEAISIEVAEKQLNDYINKFGFEYKIIEKEKGIIPMSSATIQSPDYGINWIYTGAGANLIKPTTGYAFHNMAIDAKKQSLAISSNELHKRSNRSSRFKFYDRLLLKILEQNPTEGKPIFQSLFNGVSTNKVLNFLSERSSLLDELHIFSKLPFKIFLLTALKDIWYKFSKTSPTILASIVTIAIVLLSIIKCERVLYLSVIIGFFTVGLSHGAVDHIVEQGNEGFKKLLKFSIKYIVKGALLGLLWIVLPDLALLVFLIFSAWHFGQADFREWNIKDGLGSFFWGFMVLSIILFFHLNETNAVLEKIKGLKIHQSIKLLTINQILIGKLAILFFTLLLTFFYKVKYIYLTVFYLLLSSLIPLLASFGIYFVLQHSLHGWLHLKKDLKIDSYNLWLKSLPFSFGGAMIILTFILLNNSDNISLFFILLSCLSLPHVISMNNLYLRFNAMKK